MAEAELAKYPGLYARGGVWYLRKRVPVDLQHVEQREQIRVSLGTSEKREAIKRYPLKLAEIEVGFEKLRAELRQRGKTGEALALGKAELLGRPEIEALVRQWWATRGPARAPEIDDSVDHAALVREIQEEVAEQANPRQGEPDVVQSIADRILVEAGMAARPHGSGPIRTQVRYPLVDRSTDQYRYLCELVGRASRAEAALLKDHLLVRSEAPFDPLFNRTGIPVAGHALRAGATRCIGDLIREYRAEREVVHGKESTDRKYGLLFRILEEVLGPGLPVQSVGRPECVRVLEFLRKLPPNATKRFPKLTLTQAVARADAAGLPGLAEGTVGSYMQNLSAVLRWAEDGGWGVKANSRNLSAGRKPHPSLHRVASNRRQGITGDSPYPEASLRRSNSARA